MSAQSSPTEPMAPLEDTALVTQLEAVSTALVKIDKVAAGIADLRSKYANVVFDVATTKGMKEACEARAEVREPRYEVERLRKAAKRPILDLGKKLDSEAERITNELLAIESGIDDQIKLEEKRKADEKRAKEAAEAARIAAIRGRIEDDIRAVPLAAMGRSARDIVIFIGDIEAMVIDHTFAEFQKEAEGARATTLIRLRAALASAQVMEAEQKRLAEERAAFLLQQEEEEKRLATERARIAEEERVATVARDAEAARQAAEIAAAAEANAQRIAEENAALLARQEAQLAEERRLFAERKEAERIEAERQVAREAEERRLADQRAQLERDQEALRAEREKAAVVATVSEGADIREDSVRQARDTPCDALSPPVEAPTSRQDGYIDVVFDGPPDAVAGRFVEVEDAQGKSISIGEWVERPDKHWALRVQAAELGLIPAAWMRGVTSPGGPWGPPEHDVECYAGDAPPDEQPGWIPLYRKVEGSAA